MTEPSSPIAEVSRPPSPMAVARSVRRFAWLDVQQRATVTAIVECLLPPTPVLDEATHRAVLADVVRFTHRQIEALPEFLRVPYKCAITGFEWLPLLRWGRRFAALDGTRRAACVALWSDGKLGVMRNFVKLIRGCALLAYYDHPALRDVLTAHAAAARGASRSA